VILRTPQHFSIARLLESLEADPERLVLRVERTLSFLRRTSLADFSHPRFFARGRFESPGRRCD
jgi:hypothetical protein